MTPWIVVPSRYPDIFEPFAKHLDAVAAQVFKVVIRDGDQIKVPQSFFWSLRQGKEPFVYAQAFNIGVEATGDSDIVIMGDDVTVKTPNFVEIMQKSAYEDKKRIVVPTILPHGGSPFICCYIRREILNEVGPMDDAFKGYGYEDTDYYTRYEALGYYTHVIKEVVVDHGTPGMTWFRRQDTENGIQVMKSCAENKRQFARKWNRPEMDDGQ